MPSVVFAFTGDVRRNSRATKQLQALVDMGLKVEVYCFGISEEKAGIHYHTIENPKGRGRRYFWRNHQNFKKAIAQTSADIYHASDIYVLPTLAKQAKKVKAKLVFDSRELYPHVASTANRPWISLFWHLVSNRYFPKCDAMLTVCPSISEVLHQTYGILPPTVLYNVPPRQEIIKTNLLRETFAVPPDYCVFLHQGNMQRDRGLKELVDAFQTIENAVLIFMGTGALEIPLKKQVTQLGIEHKVFFMPPTPPETMLQYTASADVGVTLVEDTCLNHRFALPNKLFEYAFAQIAILASDLHETKRLLDGFPIGIKVNPKDATALREALTELAQNKTLRQQFSANTVSFANAFTPEQFSTDFKKVYQTLL